LARLAEVARPTLLGIRNAALRNLVEGAREVAQEGRLPNQEEGCGGGLNSLEEVDMMTTTRKGQPSLFRRRFTALSR
jgi:hypothetical protein